MDLKKAMTLNFSRAKKFSKVPVIICGGVGEWSHFYDAFKKSDIDAVAAQIIFIIMTKVYI